MRKSPFVAITAAALVVLAGCSNPGEATNPDGGPAKSDLSTVTMAVNGVPDGLTASKWGGAASHIAFTGLGSQLFGYVLGDDPKAACENPDYNIKGRLAESWEFSDDGKSFTVKLADLTSQWGNKLSAEDVVWSFKTALSRDTIAKGSLASSGFDVEDIATVVDAKTVRFNLTDRRSFTDSALQQSLYNVYDSTEAKKHITAEDPIADQWLSNHLADYSGWKLDGFTPGTNLTLTADPNWGGERGSVKKIVINAVPNTATRAELVKAGKTNLANGFDYDQYADFSGAGMELEKCQSQSRDTLMFNTTAGPLADKRVRQALSMAIDRDALAAGPYAGLATPATGTFPFSTGSSTYEYDVEAAKKLLADAGYADGFPLKLTYGTSRPGPVVDKTAALIRSQLAELGVEVELEVVANATNLTTVLQKGRYEALMYAEPVVIADPAFYTAAFYTSGAPSNSTGWGDAEYDDLRLELSRTPIDQVDERKRIQKDMSAIVDDAAAILSLVVPNNMMVVSEGLTNVKLSSNGQVYFNDLGR